MIKIRVIPDKTQVEKIRKLLKENEGFCPCQIVKDKDTRCICTDFLNRVKEGYVGLCHCGLYESVEIKLN